MKIALRAANDLYVTAENGGGIDTRDPATPVALRARAGEIGPWETFTLEPIGLAGLGQYALRTCNGQVVTAENGGGAALRTNETEIGVWETFTYSDTLMAFATWDGRHLIGLAPGDDPIMDARSPFQRLVIEELEPATPPLPDLAVWRGCFCIPAALPGIPYGDGARIWTPAYGCYSDEWRAKMRAAYVDRGYTHFVYNCAGLPYASDYPELADDAARVGRDLLELRNAGLVPVVCATDDRNPWVLCSSFVANADLIPVCFPVWEMNGPLGSPDKTVEEQNCKDAIARTRAAAPLAECYLHFTPGHGSISYESEMGGWEWCQANGTTGLLAQGDNRFYAEDPQTGGEGLESTAVRLAGLTECGAPAGWAGMHQLTVKFEYGIYDMYHGSVGEDALRDYTMEFLKYAPHVSGYCDGGY